MLTHQCSPKSWALPFLLFALTLAATMNLPADTLSDEIEPYLLREQFIVRTPRGRAATAKAFALLGKPLKRAEEDEPEGGLFG